MVRLHLSHLSDVVYFLIDLLILQAAAEQSAVEIWLFPDRAAKFFLLSFLQALCTSS